MMKQIGILGDGGQADEAQACFLGEVVFRAVSGNYVKDALVDVEHPSAEQQSIPVVAAVGAPALRRQLVEQWGGDTYGSVVAASAQIDSSATVGDGSIVAQNVVVTTNVHIGRHTLLNVGASIQHNSTIGDYCTVGPGAKIGGNVTMADGVFVGIGAVVANNVTVASGVVIAAGAVVPPRANLSTENGVYVGVPAKLLTTNKEWLYEV